MRDPSELSTAPPNPPSAGSGRWTRLFRLQPFDTGTPEGRSAERYRRVAWSALSGAAARAIAIGVSFVSVPLVLDYLGDERYGMWLTISSLIAILGPLDLGIGNGLMQTVSEALGRSDTHAARRSISTAIVLLLGIAGIVAVAALVAYPAIPWPGLFNVSSPEATREAGPAAAAFIAVFVIGVPLSVPGVVQAAMQSGYITSLWSIVGSVGGLIGLIFAVRAEAALPVLVATFLGTALVAAGLNGLVLFRWQQPPLAPKLRDFRAAAARSMLRVGVFFVILQVAGIAAYQLDNFVIAQLLGAAEVQEYALPAKLFSLAPLILSFALTPLWPAYREAIARGDTSWVTRTLKRSMWLAMMINVPVVVTLVAAGPVLLDLWVGDAVSPSLALLLGLGLWTIIISLSGPLAMFMNGANVIAFQAISAVLMALANVATSVFLVDRIGVPGAVYGSIVAQTVFILIPSAWYVPRLLARLHSRATVTASP